MSKYAAELNRRIKKGEPVHVTRKWFLGCMAKEPDLCFDDLAPEEQLFLEDIAGAVFAWQKARSHN